MNVSPELIIGCLLQHGPEAAKATGIVAADFPEPIHGGLWRWLMQNTNEWIPGNTETVVGAINGCGLTEKLSNKNSAAFDFLKAAEAISASSFTHCAAEFVEAAAERRLREAGTQLGAGEITPKIFDRIRAEISERARAAGGDNTPKPLTVRRPSEILAMQFDPSDFLLANGYLAKGNALTVVGAGGLGKSRLMLQMVICCTLGRPFVGWETNAAGTRWLILQTENGNRRLQADLSRMLAGCTAEEMRILDDCLRIHTLETDEDTLVALNSEENRQRIRDLLADFPADVVVYDILRDFGAGDLNTDADMTETCRAIGRVTRESNPHRIPLVLHHALTGKAGAARAVGADRGSHGRNSKVLLGWTRAQINLAAYNADNNDVLVVASGKANDAQEFEPFAVRLNPEAMTYERDDTVDLDAWREEMGAGKASRPRATTNDVLSIVRERGHEGITKAALVKEVCSEAGCGKTLAYDLIAKAEQTKGERGIARRRKDKAYVLPMFA